MSMGAVRAGAAFIELTTRDTQLKKGLANAQARLKSFGMAANEIGTNLLSFVGTGAAAFGVAFKIFKDFDSQMRMVKAVTQATGKEFDMLVTKARKIGAETSYTAEQVAQAMTALGRMGLKPREIDAAILPVMNLARATGTDLADAADIAANSLRIFGMDASKMGDITDYLTATANGSAQTLGDLFEALKVAGPQAKTAGESIQDTAAALGIMAQMGIKGSLAGTSLRKAYLQFADPKIQAFLKDYNIRTVDANGNLRKMRDIMVDLTRAMATMGSAEKLAFAKEVFDLRGMTGGLAITADTSGLDEFIKKLDNCAGVANRTREEIESGAGGAWDTMLSALQEVGISIGEVISRSLIPLMNGITSVMQIVGDWVKQNQGLVAAIGGSVAALLAVGGTLVAVGVVVKGFAAVLGLAKVGVAAFHAVTALVPALKVAWVATMTAFSTSTAVFTAATAAGSSALAAFGIAVKAFFATNPVGWALLAVGAIAGVVLALSELNSASRECSEQVQKQNEAAEKERVADQRKMNRLAALAAKQKTTNAEMAEAHRLSAELGQKYGDLGIKFDETEKKISGVTEALKRLNDVQASKEVVEIDRQINEHRNNISTAQDYNKTWSATSWQSISSLWWDHWSLSGESTASQSVRQNNEYIALQERKIKELEERKKRLRQTGAPTAASVAAAEEENNIDSAAISFRQYLDARDKSLAIEAKFKPKKEKTPLEQELEELDKAKKTYKELLTVMLQYNAQRKKILERKKAPSEDLNKLDQEIKNLHEKISAIDSKTEEKKAVARKKYQQRESAESIAQINADEQALAEHQKQRVVRDEQKKLEVSIEALDADAAKRKIGEIIAAYQAAAQTAIDEHAKLLTSAKTADSDGIVRYTDSEKTAVTAAFEKIKASQAALDQWKSRLAESGSEVDRRNSMATGSWSITNLSGLLGGSAADRTAAASEKQNELTQKTNKKLDDLIQSVLEKSGLTYK